MIVFGVFWVIMMVCIWHLEYGRLQCLIIQNILMVFVTIVKWLTNFGCSFVVGSDAVCDSVQLWLILEMIKWKILSRAWKMGSRNQVIRANVIINVPSFQKKTFLESREKDNICCQSHWERSSSKSNYGSNMSAFAMGLQAYSLIFSRKL